MVIFLRDPNQNAGPEGLALLHVLGRFRTISQNRCQSGGASSRSEGSAEESLGRLMEDFLIKWPLEEAQFSLSQVNYLIKSIKYNPYTFDRKIKNATIQAQN